MISARTDDRSFVALLNEAMAVVLPGEPIPRAKADRRKARRNAASKSGEGALMPRIPSTAYSFLLRVTTMVLCIAGLCGVALCLMRFMTPYYEVLVSYWNLHVRRRLWAQDLQVVDDVVGIPISLHSEQESRLVLSFLGGAKLGLLGI